MVLFPFYSLGRNIAKGFIAIVFSFICTSGYSQETSDKEVEQPLTRILFVFDASQSMYGYWQSDMKFNTARSIFYKVLDTLDQIENLQLALRVYGHQFGFPPQVCSDTRLEVPFAPNNVKRIKDRLSTIYPKGTSPIAYSLAESVADFTPCDNCRNIIVLITDGIEECNGDPCEVSKNLQKNGVILKPFIIGIGKDFEEQYKCVGSYFDATTETHFTQAMNVVINRALNPTTAQVNLLNADGIPTETNINMIFYDNNSGQVRYNFVHTLNEKGLPDTLILDPLLTYDIVVNTIPRVRADSVRLLPGSHNVIPISVPQGKLKIAFDSDKAGLHDIQCIVRRKGSYETVNVQEVGETVKYITGLYNIEVLSMPRMLVTDIKLTQDLTTTVDIPTPGIVVIQKNNRGYGSLLIEQRGKLEWVYDLREDIITQESLMLLPGNYRVVFRAKTVNKTVYTIEKSFVVKSGTTTNVKIY